MLLFTASFNNLCAAVSVETLLRQPYCSPDITLLVPACWHSAAYVAFCRTVHNAVGSAKFHGFSGVTSNWWRRAESWSCCGSAEHRLLCTGCGRDLKWGTQCELCGRWHHYSCGSMTAQAAERERENWNCDKCRAEMVRMLQQEMQNALRQIDELKARNSELEAKLLMAGTGERDTMPAEQKVTKCFNIVLPCITV